MTLWRSIAPCWGWTSLPTGSNPDWGTAVRDFGAAGYSETAQVYAVANASGYSVTLSAASMTPQTFAALNTQYGEETS